jgi:diguanylate cyclase (GGDEF)-like protein
MNDIVELQLRNQGGSPHAADAEPSPWRALVQNLLRVLCEIEPESASKESASLRASLNDYRAQFGRSLHPQEERQAAAGCVRACEQYLRRIQHDHSAREAELTEMIAILREAAARFIGDSTDFHAQLLSSADRFKGMTRVDDIRDLKQQLSLEVSTLERVVEQKKQRDATAIAALSERVQVLQADLVKAEEQAALDPLTRLANRGTFDRTLARAIEQAKQAGTPFTLAMIDVDHFKNVNDTYGHLIGDRVLLCTAEWLRGAFRQTDCVARYGGEEFAAILTNMDIAHAERRFAQVLQDIASRSYQFEQDGQSKSVRFTVSCGLAQWTEKDSESDLMARADHALYEAKQKGRNRVIARKVSRLARLFS